MGNEYPEENVLKEIEPIDYSDEYIKYGIISKKGEEKSLDDCFLTLPDLTTKEGVKNPINFSLFGIFDGHNNDFVAKYLTNNLKEKFEEEAGNILEKNFEKQFGDIFKSVDKKLREEKIKNIDNKEYINDDINEKEIKYYKDLIEKTQEIPEDLKKVDDSQIKNLLLFRNLFKYNNNFIYNNNDTDYIGSSASLVMINNNYIYVAELGITKCILFNIEGKILNEVKNTEKKNENDILYFNHVFDNKSEKKRIKKFNENIDYEKLKMNIYLPASRCFGLFKYKADEILKEENQIISCVPDVICKEKDSVDFILLMTKGMVNLLKDNLDQFIKNIVGVFKTQKEADIKISELLNKYIEDKIKERDEKEKNADNKKEEIKQNAPIKNNLIYVGKEDFGEENEIINELKKNYYKDIMEMNKNSCHSCHDKYNITCMLLKVSKNKKPIIEIKKEKKSEKKDDKKDDKKEDKKDEIKEEKKEEIKVDKKEDKKEEDIDVKSENKEKEKDAKENELQKKDEENKEQPKEDKEKLEENKQENNNEDKKDINENIEKKDEEKKIEEINKINEDDKGNKNIDKKEEKKEVENNEEIK